MLNARFCKFFHQTNILCLFILLGFALRIIWILRFPNDLYADSVWYYEQAINFYQHKGYVYQGVPTAIWPVGYPAFLASVFKLLSPSLLVAKLTNVTLLTLDIVLLYRYARLTTENCIAPYLSVVFITFLPSHIAASSLVAVEPLFACLLHLVLVILLSALKWRFDWLWVLAATLVGVLAYIRPESLVVLLIIVLFYLLTQQFIKVRILSKKYLMLFLIIFTPIIIILPWTLRNWFTLGMFVPISTTACMNLWIGHAPGSEGGYYWFPDPAVNPVILREDDTEQTWYRRSCQAAIQLIRDDPLRTIKLWPKKIFKLWQDDHGILSWNLSKTTQPVLPQQTRFLYTITDSYYYVILFFGCCGIVWQLWRLRKLICLKIADCREVFAGNSCCLVGIVTIVGFTLVFLPFFGASRFHFALTPLLAVYAADFIANGIKCFRFNLLS